MKNKNLCLKEIQKLIAKIQEGNLSDSQLIKITEQISALNKTSREFQLYRLKPKKELNKIPGSKDFWYRVREEDNQVLLLRPAKTFSNDLFECSMVHRSDVLDFMVDKEGNAVHKAAVELIV